MGTVRKRGNVWCRRSESNRHGAQTPRDFESRASTSFTTPAPIVSRLLLFSHSPLGAVKLAPRTQALSAGRPKPE